MFSFGAAKEFLAYDGEIKVGAGKVLVTLPPGLHQKIMEEVGYDKRKRAEFIRHCIIMGLAPQAPQIMGAPPPPPPGTIKKSAQLMGESHPASVLSELKEVFAKQKELIEND